MTALLKFLRERGARSGDLLRADGTTFLLSFDTSGDVASLRRLPDNGFPPNPIDDIHLVAARLFRSNWNINHNHAFEVNDRFDYIHLTELLPLHKNTDVWIGGKSEIVVDGITYVRKKV